MIDWNEFNNIIYKIIQSILRKIYMHEIIKKSKYKKKKKYYIIIKIHKAEKYIKIKKIKTIKKLK